MDGGAKAGQFDARRMKRLTIATDFAGRGMRAWQASSRLDRGRLLRSARRHSALVRRLRIAIPVVAVAGIAILAAMTLFNPLRLISRLPINPGKVVVSGSKITMEAPRLSGFTRDNRAYQMTAAAAAQDIANPNVVEMRTIRAKVELKDKANIDVVAATGTFDVKSKLLTLNEDIVLVSSAGYEARLDQAVFDIQKGHIVSTKPVEVLMLNGNLTANRLEVTDNGALARFDGGVSMTVNPDRRAAPDQTGGTEGPRSASGH